MPVSDQVFPQAPAGAIFLPKGIGDEGPNDARHVVRAISKFYSLCFLILNDIL